MVPPAVRELISRAMAKRPEDRFASAAEFAEAALAASGSLDWRQQTGTSMTSTSMTRSTLLGPSMRSPGMTGTSLTGTALTRPMSPAAPSRTMPGQRNLLEAAPPLAPARRRQTKSQLAVLLTVIGLFLLAGGLALAIALQERNADAGQNQDGGGVPAVSDTAGDESETPTFSTESPSGTKAPNKPNGSTPRSSLSAAPSKTTPTPTSTSKSPTVEPTTPPPSTEPTTTTPPTTPPATTTSAPTEGGGGNDKIVDVIKS
jgi:eukaryotic-like serine/threonine-protein kinase